MPDDRLRLIFTCCHPALAPRGAGRADPAAAGRSEHGRDRARVPRPGADHGPAPGAGQGQDPRRRHPVPGARARPTCPTGCGRCWPWSTSIFNEGYTASAGERARARGPRAPRPSASAGVLAELMPDEPEVLGLLALMLLVDARRAARTTADGDARPARRPGPHAAGTASWSPRARRSSAAACAATSPAPTRSRRRSTPCTATRPPPRRPTGRQILALYDQLLALRPSPVVALNRAVALAEVDGPAGRAGRSSTRSTSTATTCSTPSAPTCCGALGRDAEAAEAYAAAIDRAENAAERDFLRRRRDGLG